MPTTPQVSWPWTGVLWPTFQTAEAIEKRPSGSDRKSTRLNSSHSQISYAVFCLKKKNARQRIDGVHADRWWTDALITAPWAGSERLGSSRARVWTSPGARDAANAAGGPASVDSC